MKIAFLGDVALFGRFSVENEQYPMIFEPIKHYLDKCDYVVANLECPLTEENKIIGGKSAYLKSSVRGVEILRHIGITHVSLANNHTFDYCSKGLQDTIRVLDENEIVWYGVNQKKAFITDNDNQIVLMGYCCYSTNGKGLDEKEYTVNELDPTFIETELSKLENKDCFPVLSLHWGQEHVHYPNYDHVEVARKLCKNRKVFIHGHHPHVIQGIEKINDSLISYSLGNFCFDDVYTKKSKQPLVRLSKDNKESFILIVDFEDNKISNYEIIPFSFEGDTYKIDEKIKEKIDEWSQFLYTPKEIFVKKRSEDLFFYLNQRKQMRDFKWYFKRMNLESVKMIIGSKNNAKKYNLLIKQYISK